MAGKLFHLIGKIYSSVFLANMKNVVRGFFAYFLTAGFAAFVDISCFYVFILWKICIVVAAICSFVASSFVNFFLTSRFVFKEKVTFQRGWRFFLGALFGLWINSSVTSFALIGFDISPVFGKLIGIGVAFSFNFIINYFFVFRLSNTNSH